MGVSMRVQTESGQARDADVYVSVDALPFDIQEYPFLGSIAPYEDTVFNPTQCARLVAEWDRAASDPRWQKQTGDLRTVRDAAAKCAAEHLYLKFIGD